MIGTDVTISFLTFFRLLLRNILFLFGFPSALASEFVYQSHSLEEPFKVEFEVKKGENLLIEATQYFADVRLSVNDLERGVEVVSVDFPFEKRLPEVLLVTEQDCMQCEVVLEGVSKADAASPFFLSIEAIDVDEREVVQLIRAAGEQHRALTDANRAVNLELIVSDLEDSSKIANDRNEMNWRWQALTLLSEQLVSLGDFDKQAHVLKTILDETTGQDSIYRVQALYEIGSIEENAATEKAGYVEGMAISMRLKKPLLWAMGANYLAILLVNEGQVSQAIRLLEQAYTITTENKSWRSLWNPLHNLSWANLRQGNNLVALKYSTELQLLANRFEDHENELWALYNIARCYRENGSQGLAEQTFDSLEEKMGLYSELSGSSVGVLRAALFQEKSELLLIYGKTAEAADYVESMRKQEQTLGFKKRLPAVTYLEGKIALTNGAIDIGTQKIQQARAHDLKNGWLRAHAAKGLYLSRLYSGQKNYLEASKLLVPSIQELSKTTDYKTIAASVTAAIEVLNGLGGFTAARKIAESSERLVKRYADQLTQLEFSINNAKTAVHVRDWDRANKLLMKARGLAHQNLKYILRKDLRKRFLELNKEIYELSIANSLRYFQDSKHALVLAGEYKAILVSDVIYNMGLSARNQKGYKDRLEFILNSLNNASKDWFRTNNEELLRKARKLSADLYKLEFQVLEKNEERLAEQLNLKPLDAPYEGQLRLSFFVGEHKSWAWVEDSTRIESFELPARAELERSISELVALTRVSPTVRNSQGAWEENQLIQRASRLLLFPIESFVSKVNDAPPKYTTLLVVPDGVLQNFPFAALQYGEENNSILDSFDIQITPGIRLNRSTSRFKKKIDPSSARAMLIANSNPFVMDNINLPRIEGVEIEIELIKESLGPRLDVFKLFPSADQAGSLTEQDQYSIIHFATHALLNHQNPLLSGLVLPMEHNANRFFIAPEIIANELKAELIVLSGCNTSSSILTGEGGLNSLSLAFIEGGAQSVVGSRWKVDDYSTATLMGYFYRNLIEVKMPPSQALAEAQRELRNSHFNWEDPYYWAGFQITKAV